MADHPVAKVLYTSVLQVRTPRGTGSAVAVGRHIITAAHVTPDLNEVVAVFGGRRSREFNAVVVGVAPDWDVAVLEHYEKETEEEVTPLRLGNGGYLGETVWHAGYPGALNVPVIRRGTVSQVLAHPGMATLVDRSMIMSDIVRPAPAALLVDMPTFWGASGGPVVGEDGRYIAMVSRAPMVRAKSDKTVELPMGLAVAVRIRMALTTSGLAEAFPDLIAT